MYRHRLIQQPQALPQPDSDMEDGHDVVNIPELFEMIMLQLPYRDIENVRLVSQIWRDRIDASIRLRRLGFLEPDLKPKGRPIRIWIHRGSLWPSGHFFSPATENDVHQELEVDSAIPRQVITVRPLLDRGPETRESFIDPQGTVDIDFPDLQSMFGWPDGGSWEKVLLTQPPCKSIEIGIYDDESWLPQYKCVKVNDEKGVRLGHVVKSLREIAFHSRKTRASVYTRPFFDFERYQMVSGVVENEVQTDSIWVRQAQRHEEFLKGQRTVDPMWFGAAGQYSIDGDA